MDKQKLFTINFLLFFASIYQAVYYYLYQDSEWKTGAFFACCFLVLLLFHRKFRHIGIVSFFLFNVFFISTTFSLSMGLGLAGIGILMFAGIILLIVDGICFQNYLTRKPTND